MHKLLRTAEQILTALSLAFLVTSWVTHNDIFAYLAFISGGIFASWGAIQTLAEKRLDVDVLMVIAAVGSLALGRPNEGAVLFFLFSLSHALEHSTMDRTQSAIEGLMKLRPSKALVQRGPDQVEVAVEEVALGETVIVSPQTQIPLDGIVLRGESAIDQSAVTGESVPVSVREGDKILGGTTNLEGSLVMETTSTVEDSTLTKIVKLVAEAQDNKASGERISAWFGSRYTWFVLAASLALLGFKLATQQPNPVYSALTLLVALSPCALVISTPATTLSALAWSARNGILVRGGRFIEMAGEVDSVAMDKTGTLTSGKPVLVEICLCQEATVSTAAECGTDGACWKFGESYSKEASALLAQAAAVEQYVSHPIAHAIVDAARKANLDIPEATNVRSFAGKGVVANVHGLEVAAGKTSLFESLQMLPPEGFLAHSQELAAEGMTVALIANGNEYAALGLRDEPRPNAQQAISAMRSLGVKMVRMFTGDNPQTAQAIAKEIELNEVRAGLLPQDKAQLVTELAQKGEKVMMVGDGINDAPALAGAHVGVAMGGLGSDIALNAADVVLMNDNLNKIPQLIKLGRKTKRVVQANLLFAGLVIATLSVLSLAGVLPLPIAVVGHEGSTVLVILNGLRLLNGPGKV